MNGTSSSTFYENNFLEAEICKMIGTSHYLSPGGRGSKDFGGSLDF